MHVEHPIAQRARQARLRPPPRGGWVEAEPLTLGAALVAVYVLELEEVDR